MKWDSYTAPRTEKGNVLQGRSTACFIINDISVLWRVVVGEKIQQIMSLFTLENTLKKTTDYYHTKWISIRTKKNSTLSEVHTSISNMESIVYYLKDFIMFLKSPGPHIGFVEGLQPTSKSANYHQTYLDSIFQNNFDYLWHAMHSRCSERASHSTQKIRRLRSLTNFAKLWFSFRICTVFRW